MKQILLVLLLLGLSAPAQNWSFFNSAYRYNYEFNNAGIITNVLFADTVSLNGNDSVFNLNRIVAECINRCATTTVTVPSGSRYFIKNLPQFLQGKIIKLPGGWTHLQDTTSQYFLSTGQIGSSWTFDSSNAISASVVASGIRNVLGQSDSVRVILLNGADSIIVSKNFGVLKFPLPYAQNKYYTLVGIERNRYYDQTALYGQKVINGWDIHNYQVGDVFCIEKDGTDAKNISGPISHNYFQQSTITSKSITANGYMYTTDQYRFGYGISLSSLVYKVDGYYVNSVPLNFNITTNTIMPENSIYPGKLVMTGDDLDDYHFNFQPGAENVGVLAKDLNGSNYKCLGGLQSSNTAVAAPAGTVVGLDGFIVNSPGNPKILESNMLWHASSIVFKEGFGKLSYHSYVHELSVYKRVTCFTRNGVSIFGPKIIGVKEITSNDQVLLYPNPAQNSVLIDVADHYSVSLLDISGRMVLHKNCEGASAIDVEGLPEGMYFISVQTTKGKLSTQKLIIER